MVDTYIYFIDFSMQILISEGSLGFVIPATLLNQSDTRSARRLLTKNGVSNLVNLGAGVFGKGATNTTLAIVAWKQLEPASIYLNDLQTTPVGMRSGEIKMELITRFHVGKILLTMIPFLPFLFLHLMKFIYFRNYRKNFLSFSQSLLEKYNAESLQIVHPCTLFQKIFMAN